jgi:hypothetical protein
MVDDSVELRKDGASNGDAPYLADKYGEFGVGRMAIQTSRIDSEGAESRGPPFWAVVYAMLTCIWATYEGVGIYGYVVRGTTFFNVWSPSTWVYDDTVAIGLWVWCSVLLCLGLACASIILLVAWLRSGKVFLAVACLCAARLLLGTFVFVLENRPYEWRSSAMWHSVPPFFLGVALMISVVLLLRSSFMVRGLCHKCGYCLVGSTSLNCSECGVERELVHVWL